MTDPDVQQRLDKIEELLGVVEELRTTLIDSFPPEILAGVTTLNNLDKTKNELKQLRGLLLEYIV